MSRSADESDRRQGQRRRVKRRAEDENPAKIRENISDALAARNRQSRYADVNRAPERNVRLRREEVLGRTVWEVFPECTPEFVSACRRAMDQGVVITFEDYYAPLDRWLENTIYPATDSITVYSRDVSERKRAEVTLRESEEKYRTLFSSLDEGFCLFEVLYDEQGKADDLRYLEVNSTFEKQTGLSQITGKTERELGLNLEQPLVEIYDQVVATGEAVRFETRVEAVNRWFDISAYRVGGSDSRRVAVLFNNITARKQAEQRMAYHAHLLENVHDAIIATDERLVITAWNRAAEGIYGWRSDEVIGRDVREVVRPTMDAARRDEVLRKVAETGSYNLESVHHRKDGPPVYIEGSVMALQDASGRLMGYVTTHRDITERKRADEELRKQNEVLRTIFDNIPLMIRFLGPDARVHLVNRTWERTLGWSLEEVRLRNFNLFNELYPDPRERRRAFELVAAATGEWADFRIRARDGRVLDATCANIRLSDGTTISIGQDITERRQAEEALRRSHEELEHRVVERTSQLTAVNEELRNEITEREKAEEALRESSRRIENILDSITDEFNAFDREWRFTYINEPALNALRRAKGEEITREEVLGKNVWEMFPEQVGSVFYQKYQDAIREQKTVGFEAQLPVTERWLEVNAYPSEAGLSVYYRDVTERKRAQEQLAYHAYLLNNVNDAVIATDDRLVVTAWNKAAEQMYGWKADEALGRSIWEVVTVEMTEEQRAEAVGQLAATGRFRTEVVTYRKDGTPVYVEGITIALRGDEEEGRITGYVSIRRDITERKQAEEAVRKAHESVTTIVDNITYKFFAFDEEWRYTNFNKQGEEQLRLLGKNPASLIGKVLWDEFPNPPSEAVYRRAMRDRVEIVNEHYYPPLGEWIENRIFPTPDGGLAIFVSYVTERKRAEERLRRSETYLAEGQRMTHTGSWAWNVSTGDLYWSEEHFRICGLDPEKEKPSYPAMQWIHPDDRAFVRKTFEKSVSERTDFELDCRVAWKDGTTRHVHNLAHPVFDAAGNLTEYVGTIIDTTERKLAEEDRTLLLRRLMHSQEEERRRMALEMHDQFGQQLSALTLKLAALKGQHSGHEELREQLENLEAIVKQLDRDVGFLAWQLRPTTLDDLGLQAALTKYFRSWAKQFGVAVELHVSGIEQDRLTPEIETTLYRIAQEALNNVAKHAQATRVDMLLERQTEQISLIIEDDGAGFDTRKASDMGDGELGLIGMRERASLVGGTVEIESQRGKGVTVFVRIPAPKVPNGDEPNE